MANISKTIIAVVLSSAMSAPAVSADRYFGADLSHANEMIDCGARYRDTNGQINDVYSIFSKHGANLVEVGLLTDGNATKYSDLLDVERAIRDAKFRGSKIALAFHFADSLGEAERHEVPRDWADIRDNPALARILYQYTYYVLTTLDRQDLMPDLVRLPVAPTTSRMGSIAVLNAAIKAVRDASQKSSTKTRVMLFIEQPERANAWVSDSAKSGIAKYDLLDIQYDARHDLAAISGTIRSLRQNSPEMNVIVEAAYPASNDEATKSALLPGYPATPEGQQKYLFDLSGTVLQAGGSGLIYQAPELVANKCSPGRPAAAAALFDREGRVNPGIDLGKRGAP